MPESAASPPTTPRSQCASPAVADDANEADAATPVAAGAAPHPHHPQGLLWRALNTEDWAPGATGDGSPAALARAGSGAAPGTPGEAADAAAAVVGASRARAATLGSVLVGPSLQQQEQQQQQQPFQGEPFFAVDAAASLSLVGGEAGQQQQAAPAHPGDGAPPFLADGAATVTLEDAVPAVAPHASSRPPASVASWTTATSTGAERTAWWTGAGGGTFTAAAARPAAGGGGEKRMRRRTPSEIVAARAARDDGVDSAPQGLWSGRLDG